MQSCPHHEFTAGQEPDDDEVDSKNDDEISSEPSKTTSIRTTHFHKLRLKLLLQLLAILGWATMLIEKGLVSATVARSTVTSSSNPNSQPNPKNIVNANIPETKANAFVSKPTKASSIAVRDSSEEIERYDLGSKPVDPGGLRDKKKPPTETKKTYSDVIVVATVGGDVIGLSRATGATLWKQSASKHSTTSGTSSSRNQGHDMREKIRHKQNGHQKEKEEANKEWEDLIFSPLVTTSTTTKSSSSGQDWRTTAVPSLDGKVYLTRERDSTSSSASPASTAIHIKDLVARAPFVDSKGRFYVGSKNSYAAALDMNTGELLRLVTGDKSTTDESFGKIFKGSDNSSSEEEQETDSSLDGRNVVWVGRVDNYVTVYDARTGEVDVHFSASEILSIAAMLYGGVSPEMAQRQQQQQYLTSPSSPDTSYKRFAREEGDSDVDNQSEGSQNPSSSSFKSSFLLLATPGGNVALRNPESGHIDWVASESFKTPVAFAIDANSGTSLDVNILPDAPVPSSSSKYLIEQLERHLSSSDNVCSDHNDNGDFDNIGQTIVGALDNGQLFAMPLGQVASLSTTGRSGFARQQFQPASSLGSRQKPKLPPVIGRQHLHDFLHHNAHYSPDQKSLAAKKCSPNSAGHPGCLVGLQSFLHENAEYPNHDSEEIDNFHPYFMVNYDRQRKNRRTWFQTFLRVMTSWIPPAVALAFVVSFEFGRRERLKAENIDLSGQPGGNNASMKPSGSNLIDSDRKELDGGSELAEKEDGLIQVTDEVLGYGGHGTIVYKGQLEGRKVAVKRMLKAYHASADREISLLIESDGHPNVVRYFLKEARGDFVYLALELCDLSLHDLICALTKRQLTQKSFKQNSLSHAVPPATRKCLLQIASGVRHLHCLRIVHRDLKPQNILLAQQNRCNEGVSDQLKQIIDVDKAQESRVSECFENDGYVPKISDMGLGKQLAGQSSFGLSTLGNVSANGSVGVDGTHMFGVAGPGSVGWQAPEVMAIRWSPESQLKSDDSDGTEAMVEASPIGVAVNIRTSRSVDIFSLGCIFYSTILPGSHPFGEWYEREANIMKSKPSTGDLEDVSVDARDLIDSMIGRNPKARPTAAQVCDHPFFWSPAKRLIFLSEFSDRIELESAVGEGSSGACGIMDVFKIERNASEVVGLAWDKSLDPDFFDNASRFRAYDPSSVRDCLRVIRNKYHHYDELPWDVKERIGPDPGGLLNYFESRFPKLLMHCYSVCRDHLPSDDPFSSKYSISSRLPSPPDSSEDFTKLTGEINVVEEENNVADSTCQAQDRDVVKAPASPKINGCVGDSDDQGHDDTNSKLHTLNMKPFADADISLQTNKPTNGVITADESAGSLSTLSDEKTMRLSPPDISKLRQQSSLAEDESKDMIIWQGSNAAKFFQCRGWMRSEDEWIRRTDAKVRKRDANIVRCANDSKYRTRLCNHWDVSGGTFCPLKKKCVFAHGPVELRVKEGKRHRWGKLVDKKGNNSNPFNSGGEDTYGAARSIETVRKGEGKWNTDKSSGKGKSKGKPGGGKKR